MSDLNLSGQQGIANSLRTPFNNAKSALEQRKQFWDRLDTDEEKKAWIDSDDPLMTEVWNIYSWLHQQFFELYREPPDA